MENSFKIPARPWGEADVKFLTANAHLLDEETKAELGLTRPEPINDFKAELDATPDAPAPVVETEPVVSVVDETVSQETPVTTDAPTVDGGLPTDAEGAVVDNTTTDNA